MAIEGIPQNSSSAPEQESNIEQFSNWREARDAAYEYAQTRIEKIKGYEAMESGERVYALKDLQETLVQEGNANRFIDQAIAAEIKVEMDNMSDTVRLEYGLPLRTPDERSGDRVVPFPSAPDYPLLYKPKSGDGVRIDEHAETPPGVLEQMTRQAA